MKKKSIVLMFVAVLFLSSCGKVPPSLDFVSPHFVVEYLHIDSLYCSSGYSSAYPYYPVIRVLPNSDISYRYRDLDGKELSGPEREIFDSLAIKNSDTAYNDMIHCTYYLSAQFMQHIHVDYDRYSSSANEIVSIDVVCDKEWDANHPAGSSLNDLLIFRGRTCCPYINGGYSGDERVSINMPLASMTPEDFRMTLYQGCYFGEKSGIELGFSAFPTAGDYPYVFTVTVTMDDGLQFTGTDKLKSPDPDR